MEDIVLKLAALRFYRTLTKGDKQSFESLDEEKRKDFYQEARGIISDLEKLNLMPAPLITVEQADEKRRTLKDRVQSKIEGFVKNLTVFKKDLFPSAELAAQIIKEVES